MVIGITVLIIAVLVIGIWIFWEMKRFKHKLYAIFLIGFVLLFYVGALISFKGQDIDFKSFDGLKQATGLYLSFFNSLFRNIVTITSNAVQMDWGANKTLG